MNDRTPQTPDEITQVIERYRREGVGPFEGIVQAELETLDAELAQYQFIGAEQADELDAQYRLNYEPSPSESIYRGLRIALATTPDEEE